LWDVRKRENLVYGLKFIQGDRIFIAEYFIVTMRQWNSKSTTVFIVGNATVVDSTIVIAIAIIAVVIIIIVVVIAVYCYKVKNRYSAENFYKVSNALTPSHKNL